LLVAFSREDAAVAFALPGAAGFLAVGEGRFAGSGRLVPAGRLCGAAAFVAFFAAPTFPFAAALAGAAACDFAAFFGASFFAAAALAVFLAVAGARPAALFFALAIRSRAPS
jgi:hypothetical protein